MVLLVLVKRNNTNDIIDETVALCFNVNADLKKTLQSTFVTAKSDAVLDGQFG